MSKSYILFVWFDYYLFLISNSFLHNRYRNLESRFVPRPDLVAMHHGDANLVDVLNQLRQKELRLESKWVTQDGNFRIATGAIGMTAMDVFRLSQHHRIISISKFFVSNVFYSIL